MKKIIIITTFAISMGFLETAVVIYLRELIYSGIFKFPLHSMPVYLLITEIGREMATLLMILGVAYLAGNNRHNRFAWFIFIFAVWDLFYYVFLKLILNWPESFFTWDILFLIPVVWIGPVLAPVILCILMILLWRVIYLSDKKEEFVILKTDYLLLLIGATICIVNFCWDNALYLLHSSKGKTIELLQLNYIPQYFNWWVFGLGCSGILLSIVNIYRRNLQKAYANQEGQLI